MAGIGGKVGARLRQVPRLALTPTLRQALAVLRMTAAELAAHLEAEAAANPWIDLTRRAPQAPLAGDDAAADQPAQADSLYAHVTAQIDAAFPGGPDRRVALAFADALAPTGWLDGDVPAVAAAAGVPVAQAAAVLMRLQRFDPPGLFARSLAECLALQAADAGQLDDGMAAVLRRLDLVAAGDMAALAAATGLSLAAATRRAQQLRRFDPKPGARFAALPPPAPPDIVVRRAPGGLEVALNDAALPALRLRPDAPDDDPRAVAARALVAAVGKRQATLLAVATHVLRHQAAAVADRAAPLRPLTQAAVAEALDLAESTVSRTVAGAVVAAPTGTRPLSAWFAQPLAQGGAAGEATADAAQAALRRLIAAERPGKPLSDAALAVRMAAAGIPVARRTVAKYRGALGIPPAAARRRPQP